MILIAVLVFFLIGLSMGLLFEKAPKVSGTGSISIGIIGALLGGFVFDALGVSIYGFWASVGMATLGAIFFLNLWYQVKTKRSFRFFSP